jgi:hypothetical protein
MYPPRQPFLCFSPGLHPLGPSESDVNEQQWLITRKEGRIGSPDWDAVCAR